MKLPLKRLTITQAVEYVYGSPTVGESQTTVDGIADLFEELAALAVEGRAKIYGIRGPRDRFARSRIRAVLIPKNTWEDHGIDLIAYARDGSGDCVPLIAARRKAAFVDLTFRRRDLWRVMGWRRIFALINRATDREPRPPTQPAEPPERVKPINVEVKGTWDSFVNEPNEKRPDIQP
jgi:hypothetical protein